jgi:hypothetical protein
MAITDIFSTSLLISLAICLLLVGSVFMYFNQKISEQNHKITSMFDLVSTMAEEVNSVKYHVQVVAGRVGIPMGMQPPQNPQNPQSLQQSHQPVMNGGINQFNPNSNLITISEDEEDDSDDDSDDDESDDEDSSDDSDDDDDNDSDDENDSDDDNDSDDEEENENSEDNNKQDITINEEDDEDLDIENLENLNFESVADLPHLPSNEASTLNDSDIKNLKKININISSNDNEHDEEEIEFESEDVSDINIKNVEVLDYKKLSLNKLRSIVTEKGVVTDASKLKKHELLKLLEVE